MVGFGIFFESSINLLCVTQHSFSNAGGTLLGSYFDHKFCVAEKILKRQFTKAAFGLFLENFKEQIAFFSARAFPLKLESFGAFREVLGLVNEKRIPQVVQSGDPVGDRSSSLRG